MTIPLSLLGDIELRPFGALSEDEHWQVLAIRNEESVRCAMFTSHEIGREEHMRWVAGISGNTSFEMFAVLYQGHLVGVVGLTEFDRENMRANWAYYLTEAVRGHGIGIAGEYAFIEKVFNELRLEKLNGEVLEFNDRILALHKRFGFVQEGVRRKHINRDGKWIDCILIGLTREEWAAEREGIRLTQFHQ